LGLAPVSGPQALALAQVLGAASVAQRASAYLKEIINIAKRLPLTGAVSS